MRQRIQRRFQNIVQVTARLSGGSAIIFIANLPDRLNSAAAGEQ